MLYNGSKFVFSCNENSGFAGKGAFVFANSATDTICHIYILGFLLYSDFEITRFSFYTQHFAVC